MFQSEQRNTGLDCSPTTALIPSLNSFWFGLLIFVCLWASNFVVEDGFELLVLAPSPLVLS